jgi:hypothetical protein
MATATKLKGVYNLNPTKAIMKQGSQAYRKAETSDVKGFKKAKPPKATTRKTK